MPLSGSASSVERDGGAVGAPPRVKELVLFARTTTNKADPDKIDAGMIAWYGETKRIVPTPPPSDDQRALTALVRRLRQLIELRTA